jgi:hypothetical protein
MRYADALAKNVVALLTRRRLASTGELKSPHERSHQTL